MDFQSDETHYYVVKKSGKVLAVSDEDIGAVEDNDLESLLANCPDWQKDVYREVADFLARPDEFVALPDQFEIDEYDMMRDFIETVKDAKAAGPPPRDPHGGG